MRLCISFNNFPSKDNIVFVLTNTRRTFPAYLSRLRGQLNEQYIFSESQCACICNALLIMCQKEKANLSQVIFMPKEEEVIDASSVDHHLISAVFSKWLRLTDFNMPCS